MRLIGMAQRMGFDPAALDLLVIERFQDALDKELPRIASEIAAFGLLALVIVDTSASMKTQTHR
jgi:hypothetical protein